MGVSEKQIARINELAHKAKAEGLTAEAGAAGAACRIHCRFQSQSEVSAGQY